MTFKLLGEICRDEVKTPTRWRIKTA